MLIKALSRELQLFGATSNQHTWEEPFNFVLLADPQFGLYNNNHSWEEERKQLLECIDAATSLTPKPKFIFILGDLLHCPVPEINKNNSEIRNVRDEQARDLVSAVDGPSGDIPVLVIPGNHDIDSAPTRDSIADYEKLWGKDYFSFWVGGVKFVAANSSLFYDDTNCPELAEKHFEWIEAEFRDAREKKAKQLFLFQHHQFYYSNWEEEDERETKIEVRQMKQYNLTALFRLPMKWRKRFLPLLQKYEVSASFHGHLHSDKLSLNKNIFQFVCSACGFATNDGRPGCQLVEVQSEGFNSKFIPVSWLTNNYPFMPPRF